MEQNIILKRKIENIINLCTLYGLENPIWAVTEDLAYYIHQFTACNTNLYNCARECKRRLDECTPDMYFDLKDLARKGMGKWGKYDNIREQLETNFNYIEYWARQDGNWYD